MYLKAHIQERLNIENLMNDNSYNKIVEWFVGEIKEDILWSDADVSDKRIQEIAIHKANSIKQIMEEHQ